MKECETCGSETTQYGQELICPVCGSVYRRDKREIDGWTFAGCEDLLEVKNEKA